ncbi:hypothetical protein LJC74_03755 [Eubacteriales bacterium OttesenSCG-928-A19]|nr:hypothetical protein [Eubacteriales bacterium OttesenSCG-928-A19]
MQHCNRLYTGYCLSCGGYDIPITCDNCGAEIGEYDEYHEVSGPCMTRRQLCAACYREHILDDDEEEPMICEQEAIPASGAAGLRIKTVTGKEIIVSGPVERHEEEGIYYCGGESWPEEIVAEVLMDESRSA